MEIIITIVKFVIIIIIIIIIITHLYGASNTHFDQRHLTNENQ